MWQDSVHSRREKTEAFRKKRGKAVSWRWDRCRQNLQDSGQWCVWVGLGGWAETKTAISSASAQQHLSSIMCSAVAVEQICVLFNSRSSCRANNFRRSARELPGRGAFLGTSAEPVDLRLRCEVLRRLEENAEAMGISKNQDGGNFYKAWKKKVKELRSDRRIRTLLQLY